jgi:hypothetical protein
MKPPIPNYKNRLLQHFPSPKVFDELGIDDKNTDNYFDGWSFVKNNPNNI